MPVLLVILCCEKAIVDTRSQFGEGYRDEFSKAFLITDLVHKALRRNEDSLLAKDGEAKYFTSVLLAMSVDMQERGKLTILLCEVLEGGDRKLRVEICDVAYNGVTFRARNRHGVPHIDGCGHCHWMVALF